MAQDTKLNLLLEARNNASAKLKEVAGDIGKLDATAGMAAKGVSGLMGAFAIGGIAAFASGVGSAVVEMARLSAQANQVESAFRGMQWASGESADGILAAMQRASGGTVSNTDLMLDANRAMMLGVAKSSEELTALMNVAATRGRAMGMSMGDAFNDIVTGLGRGSALILDNLGIVIDAERVNAEYAASIGKTTASLTEQEKKQALINSVMKEAAGIKPPDWNTPASDFERMNTSIQNAKEALGELFGPAVAAVAQKIADAVNGAMSMMDNAPSVGGFTDDISELYTSIQRLKDSGLTENDLPIKQLRDQIALTKELRAELQLRANQEMSLSEWQKSNSVDTSGLEGRANAIKAEIANLHTLLSAPNVADWEVAGWTRQLEEFEAQLLSVQAQIGGANAQIREGGYAWMAYTAATTAAKTAIEETASAEASLQAATQSASNFNAVLSLLIGNIEGLRSDQINDLAGNAQMLFEQLVAGGMSADEALKEVKSQIDQVIPALQSMNEAARDAAGGHAEAAAKVLELANRANFALSPLRALNDVMWEAGKAGATAVRGYGAAAAGITQLAGAALIAASNAAHAHAIIEGINQTTQLKRGWEDVRKTFGAWDAEVQGAKGGAALQQVAYMSYPAAKGVDSVTNATSALNQQFDDLKSKAQGVLSGALNLGDIKFPEAPRGDAINENARRLAAIANEGLGNQPWMDEFKKEVPDVYKALSESGDPKGMAQQMMRDFQDGLMPQLLDKDMAKERVRRMILGDQNMASLANEIAQELSQEMGISLADAQKATGAALGTSGTGESAGMMDGNKEGNRFVDGVSSALATREQEFYTAGANAGIQWGSGFLSEAEAGVPMALIIMLAGLVKASLDAQAASNASRTGAK